MTALAPPLHYVERGDGEPLLLLHGDLSNGDAAWGAQLRSLSESHHVIVPDRRGSGASPREPRPYTFEGEAADVLDVADAAGAATFHLVGHSYGGIVAIEVARRASERVRSLHVIEPPYVGLLADDPDVTPLTVQGSDLFRHAAESPPERIAERFVTMLAGPEALARAKERPFWPVIVAEAARITWAQPPNDYPPEAAAGLRLDVPVRIYRGSRSHPGLRKIAARLAEMILGAKLVEIQDAGHELQRSPAFDEALLAGMHRARGDQQRAGNVPAS